MITKLIGHDKLVESLSFSNDGKVLASGSGDKKTILWHLDHYNNNNSAYDDLSLDSLLETGCIWLKDYLTTNPKLEEDLQHFCKDIDS